MAWPGRDCNTHWLTGWALQSGGRGGPMAARAAPPRTRRRTRERTVRAITPPGLLGAQSNRTTVGREGHRPGRSGSEARLVTVVLVHLRLQGGGAITTPRPVVQCPGLNVVGVHLPLVDIGPPLLRPAALLLGR